MTPLRARSAAFPSPRWRCPPHCGDTQPAEQLAGTVFRGAEAAAREARQLVAGLRLDSPDQHLAGTVASICRAWSNKSGIPVQLDLRPVDPAIAVRYELTRILHEALVNVERHANARQVNVNLGQSRGNLRLVVTDDGVGLPGEPRGPASGHFGIGGMLERAKNINGSLRIDSGRTGGVRVTLVVPLRDSDESNGGSGQRAHAHRVRAT
jgi:signal transduction histidine kinase